MRSTSNNMLFAKNIEKLNKMAELEENWNDEGAGRFDPILISNVKHLLTKLDLFQPNIFPTNESFIQAEFYVQKNYLELILSKSRCEVYITDGENQNNDIFEDYNYDEKRIISTIQKFFYNSRHGECTEGEAIAVITALMHTGD